MENKLNSNEASQRLSELISWNITENTKLEKEYDFSNFLESLDFVNQVGKISEKQNHHPDIKISYNKVKIELSTHSLNGLTNKDFKLAKEIDKIKDLRIKSIEIESIKPGKYRHFKGKNYEVLVVARDSENLEKYVVYKALYNSPEFGEGAFWTRPLRNFLEEVEVDGQKVKRFEFIE
jgi:4a-hydroxytetrahydrobiopterin dehydratase